MTTEVYVCQGAKHVAMVEFLGVEATHVQAKHLGGRNESENPNSYLDGDLSNSHGVP